MPLPKKAKLDELESTFDAPPMIGLFGPHHAPGDTILQKLGQPSFWSYVGYQSKALCSI